MFELRWLIAFTFILIVVDFWLGVSAAISRGDKFRFSRAGRRTVNKFVDYVCYLLLGGALGVAIAEPLGVCSHETAATLMIALASVFELDSITDHFCELHGITKRISLKRIILRLLRRRIIKEIDDK